ncbi:MAG: amidohydrolase, partial [Ignavibacteria bacterium]|nr:amidohydrolase [Ignavibacteria bacterium]
IEGNKIIFVGTGKDVQNYIDDQTKIINLEGKLMLPGFIDNHVHFTSGGFYLLGIDLRPAKSTEEFKQILRNYVEEHKGKWITGGNWDHEAWEITELPAKEMIDDFSTNTPIFVDRFDGHMGLANSHALKLAGITKDTESPEGGLIVKDPVTGEPTGILKDNAMQLIYKVIPSHSDEEIYKAALTSLDEAKRLGVTSIQDMTYPMDLKVYKKLEKENNLTCRIYTRYPVDLYEELIDMEVTAGTGSDKLKLGSLKGFTDGSLGSMTAWFFSAYNQDTTTSGLPMDIVLNGDLEDWAFDADEHKLQMSIHAIGDAANAYILNLYKKIKEENPEWDRRFRIEHAQHVRFEDIPKFREVGVIASVQPFHCIDDGVWAEKRIGDRIKYTYPFAAFLDFGVKLCFGTDWPVAPLNPLLGIYAAVTRRTLDDKNPNGWIPEQKISVEDAIKCYTLNSAYAGFEENNKGSIEVGKLADLVVLSDDILTINPVKIKDVTVEMTIFDGEVIFNRE